MDTEERFETHETRETLHSREFLLWEGLKKAYRTAAVIGLTMIGSLFVYAVVAEIIKMQQAPFQGYAPLPEIAIFRAVFAGVAILEFFVIRLVRRMALTGKLPAAGAGSPGVPYPAEAQRLVRASIVTFVLCESVGIYGLVLFLMNGNSGDLYGFLGLSLLYFAVYFPRYSAWEEWVRGQERSAGAKRG